jgi:hypothetical protein
MYIVNGYTIRKFKGHKSWWVIERDGKYVTAIYLLKRAKEYADQN